MLSRQEWTKPSLEDFIAWLETKDPNEEYEWLSINICPCTQYAKSIGEKDWPAKHNDLKTAKGKVWYALNHLAHNASPRTFGSLLALAIERKALT